MLAPLTGREARLVSYLEKQMRQLVVPSFAEMARAAGFSSKGCGIARLLEGLEDRGYLTRERGKRRSVQLLYSADGYRFNVGSVRVPLVGRIAAGEPLPVPSADYRPFIGDMVELSREMLGGSDDVYALRVQGDSMIDALVSDGDIVIMEHRPAVDDGQMAAVWIKGKEETTLKYFHHEGDRVRLQPAHPTMSPLYFHPSEVEVQGKVLMVVRSVN